LLVSEWGLRQREALDEPLRAFPSWFLRITCDRCGKDRIISETHAAWHDRSLRQILGKTRHDGCGGVPGETELLLGSRAHQSVQCGGPCCALR
jgi:hypothetical protein